MTKKGMGIKNTMYINKIEAVIENVSEEELETERDKKDENR